MMSLAKIRSTLQRLGIVSLLAICSGISVTPIRAQSAADYRELGLQYRDQGQLPEAVDAFREASKLDPASLPGRVNLGWTLHLAGQGQEAAQVLREAISLDPFHVQTFNALGIIYLVNDDLLGAVVAHNWAALLEPDNEIPHYNLSLAYERLTEYDWAIAAAKRAVILEPDNPHPLVALAIAQWGKSDATTAQQSFQQAIELDSRYGESSFLEYLTEAGFNAEQISTAKAVLATLSE